MQTVLNTTEEKMQKSLGVLDGEYKEIRAGRANPNVLNHITVDYYGTPTPINQVAAVSVSEARVLVVQPWDGSLLKALEKAIQASDIGINPSNDGKVLRIAFPQLTEERRMDIVKQVRKLGEDAKVTVRNIRRDALDKFKAMKKNNELSEDDVKNGEKKVQALTDKYCASVDELAKKKEAEIMEL